MTTAAETGFFCFSTDDLPGRDPARALRELNDRNVVFRLDPLPGRSVHAQIAAHRGPELRLMSATLHGVSHGASPAATAGGAGDELLFASALSGSTVAQQRGREVTLADGDAILLRREDGSFRLTHPDVVRFLGLRVPRGALAPLTTKLDDAVMTRIPRNTSALKLLVTYLGAVAQQRMLDAPHTRLIIARHVYDLLALTIGATRDASALASVGGLRAARLHAIRADIMAKLDDPGLSVASIAARHRMTPRYVHKLFESGGVTFSEFLLASRLEHVYRMLTDPRLGERSISTLAFAAGFGDLSHFNRAFRRRYGATPSDVRRRIRASTRLDGGEPFRP